MSDLMLMFKIEGWVANTEVMRSTYMCKKSFEQLGYELVKNEKRLY